ncbi:MAG: Efflux transporter, RND family, MFP subunit, partial [Candidatus Shapirobacteria bacterium GW2011_GWE1_38_92]
DDVIVIPSTAIKTVNNISTVQILKDGIATSVEVETGDSNDSQTEIVSGINEGDVVVTSIINTSATSKSTGSGSNSSSLFGGSNMGSGIMMGGAPPGELRQ